ncbi:MAG: uracil-DNA glycosylase [Candidatus Chaera renei]|uniref:Type-4 uracil-DNA glycosylase n=1 Tax=Candidatus Chaera renei TaxID=2506947 RepID=A0A4V1J7M3_9BACT|nr:MAG: uracil-DNA glycosylase [Candidatus Chaera renei]
MAIQPDKAAMLERIRRDILKNQICPELAAGATNLVMGEGSVDADIMFIGEAPGKNEDLQGRPFVGAAGKFLDEMLRGVNLRRQDVYITNIVKYRPPDNRDPLPEEKLAFWPYLLRQLAVIRPKVVVTLGRHSLEHFLPGRQISAVHGQPKRLKIIFPGGNQPSGLVILPLYHPAAALYNGSMRLTLMDDFARLPEVINQDSSNSN